VGEYGALRRPDKFTGSLPGWSLKVEDNQSRGRWRQLTLFGRSSLLPTPLLQPEISTKIAGSQFGITVRKMDENFLEEVAAQLARPNGDGADAMGNKMNDKT